MGERETTSDDAAQSTEGPGNVSVDEPTEPTLDPDDPLTEPNSETSDES